MPMLALVVGLLALPFVIAGGLYFLGWQPSRTGNHGQIVSPPLPLPASGLKTPDGRPLATAELQDKWLLLLNGKGRCEAVCAQRIDEMRRIQVSLNKDMGRLRRVVLTDQPVDPAFTMAVQRQPDLVLAEAPVKWLPGSGVQAGYSLHIIDPRGNLIMTDPADVAAKNVRGDLERLLKFAWTG
jgi:cytochrome oxidase Cu insertion factor (SCO1/SenC/PrrC family)